MPSPWFGSVDAMRALTVRWWSMEPGFDPTDPTYVPPVPHPQPAFVELTASPSRITWATCALAAVNAVLNVVILLSL